MAQHLASHKNSIRFGVHMSLFRTFFPTFSASNEVYLDSAATSMRLHVCLTAMQAYYEQYNANVHRGSYESAIRASNEYEDARIGIAKFLGADNPAQIVFTSGTTDAINIIANGLNIHDLQGSEIWLCESEHHANLLPWQTFAKKYNLTLKRICLGTNGTFGKEQLTNTLAQLTNKAAIVAIAHVSNALGNVYPVEQLCKKAKEIGALSIIDGTQACAHVKIDVGAIDCDFYAISAHKMYAGTGIGALCGKASWLDKLSPSKLGGEMISTVTWDDYTLQPSPGKFEAGTPNIAGAIGLAKAATFIAKHFSQIEIHEQALKIHLLSKLRPLVYSGKIVLLGNIGIALDMQKILSSIALVSFYSPTIHANDIATHLASQDIAVRAGHHCAMPLMQSLGIEGCVRVSVGCYTSFDELDAFVKSLCLLFDDDKGFTQLLGQKGDALPIGEAIASVQDWNAKHRLLLINSKSLPILPEPMRTKKNEVVGCEARVWLAFVPQENRKIKILAYSESKVVRGILAIIIETINHTPQKDMSLLNISDYLHQIGLSRYFSLGRRDGVSQVIQRIEHELKAFI